LALPYFEHGAETSKLSRKNLMPSIKMTLDAFNAAKASVDERYVKVRS
jgi:hypothetical protein